MWFVIGGYGWHVPSGNVTYSAAFRHLVQDLVEFSPYCLVLWAALRLRES